MLATIVTVSQEIRQISDTQSNMSITVTFSRSRYDCLRHDIILRLSAHNGHYNQCLGVVADSTELELVS